MLRVAVRLPPAPGRIGDWLPDVTALEAAGADTIWLEAKTAAAEPWILLGAAAAVTHRVLLGCLLGTIVAGAAAGRLDGLDTLASLCAGRVVVGVRPGPLVGRLKGRSDASILLICRTHGEATRSARLADGVILPGAIDDVRSLRADGEAAFELWADAAVPSDRSGWATLIASLEAAGATGVIVPWDPRLIDLLRGAGEPDDRSDLLIATG